MRSPLASSAGAPPDQSSLGWLVMIPLGCLVLGQLALALTGAVPVLDGALGDTDAYMRLSRVLELHHSGNWFDSRFPRINPPEGHVQHWTRLLDALLLAGAWLLQPFLGFERALHLWGVLISPVCLALTVVTLAWAARPVLSRDARMLACLALLLQPTVLAYASLGRPDHHALLLLLFVTLLGITFRLLRDPRAIRTAAAAGLVAAVSLWVSPEALTFIVPGLFALGVVWLLGETAMAATIRRYLVALTITLAAALLIERGFAALGQVETDRLSILHLATFAVLALVWILIEAWQQAGAPRPAPDSKPHDPSGPRLPAWRDIMIRTGVAATATFGVGFCLMLVFPELRAGPLGQVDPIYAQVRLHRILEVQPLLSPARLAEDGLSQLMHRVIRYVGLAFLAVPFLVMLVVRERGDSRRIWACIALNLAIFLALASYQIRWASYAQLLLLLPYSALLCWLLHRVCAQMSPRAIAFCRAPVIVAGLLWPLFVLQLLQPPNIETAGKSCPIERIATGLEQSLGSEPQTIMAFADYGPRILYHSNHSVLSIPNHRPQPGFTATYRALTARDDAVARAILAEHDVDLILLCPSAVERSIFTPADGGSGHLYERLVDGPLPVWLRPITLGDGGDPALNARILQVLPEPAVAQGSADGSF